jgi:hypothetical protein
LDLSGVLIEIIFKMPMSKNSTLIYFVNNFQADLVSSFLEKEEKSLESSLTKMENAENAPSEQTITNILNFARSYEVLETKETGYVDINLN